MKIQNITENYLKNKMPNKGVIIYEAGYQIETHKKEVEIGEWIYSVFGGTLTFLQEVYECNKKTPDYLWNGKYWELKSISSAKAADSALRAAVKQIQGNPGGIILELTKDIELDVLEKVISGRFRRVYLDELDILIVKQRVLKKVLRYKK